MRVALFVAGLALAAPSIARAEVINLSCSGTFWSPGNPPTNSSVSNRGIQIDLDNKQVSGLMANTFPITRISKTDIGFSLPWSFDAGVQGTVGGSLDRITGKLEFSGLKNTNPMVMAFSFNFECRPAKPIF